eukprot:Skav204229  [mRNA]  locus=scaffold1550:186692:187531:- [translate_table: standard]
MGAIQQLLRVLLMWTKLMPFVIVSLTCCSFMATLTWDMFSGAELFREWFFWLYGHWEDSCNQPIGPLQQWFWIVLWLKILVLASLARWWHEESDGRLWIKKLFLYVLSPLALVFDLGWPIVTLVCLCYAGDCSRILQQSCWLLLTPYLLQGSVALFTMARPYLKQWTERDRTRFLRDFHLQVVPIRDNGLCPGGSSICSICLAGFEPNDQSVVVLPCANNQHIFHAVCLAGWLKVSESCPLCRHPLSRRARSRLIPSELTQITQRRTQMSRFFTEDVFI